MNIKSILIVTFVLMVSMRAQSDEPKVSLFFRKSAHPKGVQYEYQVVNRGKYPISGITVGGASSRPQETSQLTQDPVQILSPQKWTSEVETEEESVHFDIFWTTNEDRVLPSQTRTGFVVILAKDDPAYSLGPFEIDFYSDGFTEPDYVGQPVENPQAFTANVLKIIVKPIKKQSESNKGIPKRTVVSPAPRTSPRN